MSLSYESSLNSLHILPHNIHTFIFLFFIYFKESINIEATSMISTQTPKRHEFQPHNDQFHLYFFSPLTQQVASHESGCILRSPHENNCIFH